MPIFLSAAMAKKYKSWLLLHLQNENLTVT